MKNIRIFYLKNCHFLVVKFSIYLNRHVFVMICETLDYYAGLSGSDVRPTGDHEVAGSILAGFAFVEI